MEAMIAFNVYIKMFLLSFPIIYMEKIQANDDDVIRELSVRPYS